MTPYNLHWNASRERWMLHYGDVWVSIDPMKLPSPLWTRPNNHLRTDQWVRRFIRRLQRGGSEKERALREVM